jgi:hypothetical protein
VARLGEFSPLGRLFTLGSVLKITEISLFFGGGVLLFSSVPVMY